MAAPFLSCRCRVAGLHAGRRVSARCKSQDIPLAGGSGFLRTWQRPDEITLYGPGNLGFQMSRWHSGRHPGLIPYTHPQPPVLAHAAVEYELWDGGPIISQVTLHGQPMGLLGVPATAGALPSPSAATADRELAQEHEQAMYIRPTSKSPRRSLKMQYTCNRCTTRNVIDVNPHAYHTGTVFVQCGGCGVRHKLVDHLEVVKEMSGGSGEGFITAGSTPEDRLRAIMPERMLPDLP